MSNEFYAKIKEEGQTCNEPSKHGCGLPTSEKALKKINDFFKEFGGGFSIQSQYYKNTGRFHE